MKITEDLEMLNDMLKQFRDDLDKGKIHVPKYHNYKDKKATPKYHPKNHGHGNYGGFSEMERRAESADAILATNEALREARKNRYAEDQQAKKAAYLQRRNEEEAERIAMLPYAGMHARTRDVLINIEVGNLVFLVGPAGSGKTHMAQEIAKKLELSFYFTGSVHQKHELLGFIDANGKLTRTPFREAYEHGGLFLFDEYDASSPHAITPFNAALSNGQCAFPDLIMDQHKDFIAIAAGNTYGTGANRQYVGRFQQDAASLDRFVFIEIDYDNDLESRLAAEAFESQNGDKSKIAIVNHWIVELRRVRKAINEMGIRHIVSPRAAIMGSKLIAKGVKDDFLKTSLIYKGMSPDQVSQIKAWINEDQKGGKKGADRKKEILKEFAS